MEAYINIFKRIEEEAIKGCKKKKRILGVNGVDTSGKTEFATALTKYFLDQGYKTQLIHIDDFHHPRAIRKQGSSEIDAYIHHAFNLEALEKELLLPIQQGEVVDKTLKLLDLEADTYRKKKHFYIDHETIVILEGVLLYRPPINRYFDYRIYLDIPFSEVLDRAMVRDVPKYGLEFLERYKIKYIPIQKQYMKAHQPIEKSHMVIDNTDYHQPKLITVKKRRGDSNG